MLAGNGRGLACSGLAGLLLARLKCNLWGSTEAVWSEGSRQEIQYISSLKCRGAWDGYLPPPYAVRTHQELPLAQPQAFQLYTITQDSAL